MDLVWVVYERLGVISHIDTSDISMLYFFYWTEMSVGSSCNTPHGAWLNFFGNVPTTVVVHYNLFTFISTEAMSDEHQDQQFLEYIVRAIVNHPEDVKSTRTVDERGVLITLDVNSSDIGYVIGRRGQTVRALRTLLRVVGAKNNASVNLKINEPEGGQRFRRDDERGPAPSAIEEVDTSAIDNLNI